jgi:hypothetical protein
MKTDHKIWRFDSDQDRLAGSPASQRTPAVGSFRPELAEGRAKAANLTEFERSMIRQRVHAGLKRAIAQGKQLESASKLNCEPAEAS